MNRKTGAIILFLTVLVFTAYGNTLFNRFVYDDSYLIVKNDFIKDLRFLPKILTSDVTVTTPYQAASGYYRPISMVFLMLIYRMCDLHPIGYHLVSILLHLISIILVFFIFQKIFKKTPSALAAAVLFAVHPIHVEAVAPVYNYMGLLSAAFGLASFWAYLKSEGLKKKRVMVYSVIFYALSLFSKEDMFFLPAGFMIYDFIFLSSYQAKEVLKKWKKYALFALIALFYVGARVMCTERPAALGFWHLNLFFNIGEPRGIFQYVNMIIQVYYHYVLLLFFPFRLNAFHWIPGVASLNAFQFLTAPVIVLPLIYYAFIAARRHPKVSFLIFLFFLSSIMTSNLIPIGGIFAERFMYVPSMAFCGMVGLVVGSIIEADLSAKKQKTKITGLLFILVCFIFVIQTVARNYVWRTDISLWKDAVQKTPNAMTPHLNLAEAYEKSGHEGLALQEYEIAARYPDWKKPFIYNKIGKIYGRKGDYARALKEFQKALQLNQREAEFFYNAGISSFYLKDNKNAAWHFREGIKRDSNYSWNYYGLGLVYEKQKQKKKSRAMFEKAVELNPDFSLANEALKN